MKIQVINHSNEQPIQVVKDQNGIYVWDGNGEEYRISVNQFGDLEIYSSRANILVKPCVANHIVIKTER